MSKETITITSLEIKGVVLGGGQGTRLRPLTLETNKHLLPVGEKPLILYPIEQLLKAGVKDILLLIDDCHASQFMQLLQDASHLGIRSLAYVWQPREGRGLPTAIAQVEPFIRDGKIVVVCGDVIVENGIAQPVSDFVKQPEGARLTTIYSKDTAGYSPLETSGDLIIDILPKDKSRHDPGLIDLGVYMYHPDVFSHIRNLVPSARGETEIWELNRIYATKQQLFYTVVDGWWCDVGESLESYQAADQRYASRK